MRRAELIHNAGNDAKPIWKIAERLQRENK
jgi:hypothetical protein